MTPPNQLHPHRPASPPGFLFSVHRGLTRLAALYPPCIMPTWMSDVKMELSAAYPQPAWKQAGFLFCPVFDERAIR